LILAFGLSLWSGCASFPERHSLPTDPTASLAPNVARVDHYQSYRENNILADGTHTGDFVAEVYLQAPLSGLAGISFQSFELNFYVPRNRALPEGCVPAKAYELAGPFHYSYFKDSWRTLMQALNSGRPMYARWDLNQLTADLSFDPTFTTPQPWPPLQIDPTSRPGEFPKSHDLPPGPTLSLPLTVARIKNYANYHENNILADGTHTGDYVATINLDSSLPGLAGITFPGFELNFYVPRTRALPEGAVPPNGYERDGPFHYAYFKDALPALMAALNGDRPMYARWDPDHLTADISFDPTFTTPQPWPPLQIDPTPRPPQMPQSK
jgi:hypothetical protein